MLKVVLAISAAFLFFTAKAYGENHFTGYQPKPRPITSLMVGPQKIEMLAVTQRARADTKLRRDYLAECQAFSKVMPGYPQPAFVSVDFRIAF